MIRFRPGKHQLWAVIFVLWASIILGVVGSPGVVQAIRVHNLLGVKTAQAGSLEEEIARLEQESARLERSPIAQEKEIRRTLGYAAPDELIFDFSAQDKNSQE